MGIPEAAVVDIVSSFLVDDDVPQCGHVMYHGHVLGWSDSLKYIA